MTGKPDPSAWRVLIVDDDPDSLEIVTRILSFHGARVQTVSSGAMALETLKYLTPTLIIMDLSMPQVDGWETLYLLKKNPEFRDIPVIALTAHAMKGDRERALAAGFRSYISKPLNPLSFLGDVASVLDQDGSHQDGRIPEISYEGRQSAQ